MGHTRIGRLRRTNQWKSIVASFCAGISFDRLAGNILQATRENLNEKNLTRDAAYQKSVFLLVQMGIGAQTKNFLEHMRSVGIDLSPQPSVQELIGKISEAVDDAAWKNNTVKTDFGEFAKLGLINAISHIAHLEVDINPRLPGMPPVPDLSIFNSFGERHNLAELNRRFISDTMSRALNCYMAKIIPNLVGHAERVLSLHELNDAYEALARHCYETSQVHRDISSDWLAKHQYQLKDMSDKEIVKHANHMVKKMLDALIYGVD